MLDQWLSLILDESRWLTVAMGTAFLAVTLTLYRERRRRVATQARILSAMTMLFAVTIGVMAFGHLLAVTIKLVNGTLVGSTPKVYTIGVALAVPSWCLLVHVVRHFSQIHNRTTLLLNGWLAFTLIALGVPNVPLALPGVLNVAYQATTRRAMGWAIAGATLILLLALFIGPLIFWASGQTFEQFSGIESSASAQDRPSIRNADGLQVVIATEITEPVLRVVLPGHATSDRSIEVIFPEHVTAVKQGSTIAEQLYLFRSSGRAERPEWRQGARFVEYQRDLPGDIHLLARATLEDDGVRFRYEFTNRSRVVYNMIYAVTDPRLTGIFHDIRLERTYVHHTDGFDLLASDTPSRLTIPLNQWLPARYLASFTWPVPAQRLEKRSDGIAYYNKSRAVDLPFIATLSIDKAWVVASFAREAGNVWSNPELTCQHVDPQTPLLPGVQVTREVKMLVIQGTLDDALQRALAQRASLK